MLSKQSARKVIVNADDMGWSKGVIEGIIYTHVHGIVTSTTLMANMPLAAHAITLLKQTPSLGVGVHLNVSQGPALSKLGKHWLAQADGCMSRSAIKIALDCFLRPKILVAIGEEFNAQIAWVKDHGICPTHLDTHRHLHAVPSLFNIVAGLARRYGIRYIRCYGEYLRSASWPGASLRQKAISKSLNILNKVKHSQRVPFYGTQGTLGIAHTGLLGVDWFLHIASQLPPGVMEIMVHPGTGDVATLGDTRLTCSRRQELDALCDPRVVDTFKRNNLELMHYGHLMLS